MKKLFSLLVLCAITFAAYSQKPDDGDMAFTFGINGLADIKTNTDFGDMTTLLWRYYIGNDMAVRVRADLLLSSDKNDVTDTSEAAEHDKTSSHMVNLHLGIQKSMGNLERLEPYLAPELVFGFGKTNITDNTTIFDSKNSLEVKTEPGSTFSIGLVLNTGFDYWFTDHFGVGAEFGYGIGYSHTGDETVTTTSVSGGTTTTTTDSQTSTSKSFSLSGTGATGLVTVTVAFGK